MKGHIRHFYLVLKITLKIQLCSKSGTEQGEESVASGTFEDIEDFVFVLGGWSGHFLTVDFASPLSCLRFANLVLPSDNRKAGTLLWGLIGGASS